jgi:hypothetical protein
MFRSIFGARCWRLAAVLAPAFLFVWSGTQAGSLSDRDEVRESVVRIEVEHAQGTRQGTGFIINDNRTIATNNHVIEGAKSIYVTFLANGKPTSIPGRLIATDPVKDMALIETVIDIYGEPVVLADYDTNPPAKVTAIGYPVAADFVAGGMLPTIMLEPSYSVGTVARIVSNAKMLGGARLIQHTAVVNPGNSGGPLFDECGRVIGINTLRTPPKEFDYAQGIFFAVDIRELHTMLEDNVIKAVKSDKPCTPGLDTKNDIEPATTKEAEAPMFDRFAACIRARPCDRDQCKGRYIKRVANEMATTRQGDIDVRMSASEPNCTEQKEAEAYGEFQRCNYQQPCEFEKTCGPKLEEALAADSMKKRRTLYDRARTQAVADCKAASAPGVWRGAETEAGIWTATVSNESGAALVVRCDVSGPTPGAGVILLGAVAGKRDRWTGTRAIQMTVDSFAEPLRLDLKTQDADLTAGVKHIESMDNRGWLKELVGKFSVGSVVTFEEPKVSLDETFSLGGAQEVLAPCLKSKFVEPQQQ